MPLNTKAIKRRIKSVTNTKKITKAMEMVSAAKMRRAVSAALHTRSYAVLSQELAETLAHLEHEPHALMSVRPVKNLLVVLVSSNRGLCGSFNSTMFRRLRAVLQDKDTLAYHRLPGGQDVPPVNGVNISIIGVGKKSAQFAKKNKYPLVAVYESLSEKPRFDDVIPISAMITEEYVKGAYDKVVVAFMNYVSSLNQEPKIRQLLPISTKDLQKMIDQLGRDPIHEAGAPKKIEEETREEKKTYGSIEEYAFEPDQNTILSYILPRLVEIQLFQAVLESAASEHSARMMAMRNASDAARDMIDGLRLTYNKARQAGITQEIAEIAGGAAALE